MIHDSIIRPQLVTGDKKLHDVTTEICRPIENKPSSSWIVGFILSVIFLGILLISLGVTLWFGIGTWGLNKTVQWGWDITNFVFWVGIGHAGTLISAILLLFRQKWRMSINRSADDHLRCNVCGYFPIIPHGSYLGRGLLGIPIAKRFWFIVG